MRESSTYLAILEEGRVLGVKKLLLRQGTRRFGPPEAEMLAKLNGSEDLGWLERLADGVLVVNNWAELLATP